MNALQNKLILGCMFLIAFGAMGSGSAWALDDPPGVLLSDRELDQVRGGFAGIFFGVHFTGFWDTMGNVSGSLISEGNIQPTTSSQLPAPGGQAAMEQSVGAANIQAYVGNFNGASGIFQISQSPGSYNVIQNNLMVRITMIQVANESAVPSLLNMLR